MAKTPSSFHFDHKGIGSALHGTRLKVPPNQREYSWEEKHVRDLFQDIANAIQGNKSTYFLGTIVLTSGDTPEVVDGQQRLATITILLAAMRDWLFENKLEMLYASLENDLLQTVDRDKQEIVPRLTLNVDDNEFFRHRIVSRPGSEERVVQVRKDSHLRIEKAAEIAKECVQDIVKGHKDKNKISRINEWLHYIENNASVILLTVPSDLNAYVMFETLNDRGLRTSQADLVKNYLFGEADDRLIEAQQKWSSMATSLEPLAIDDVILVYLRHLTRALHGPTEDKEIFEKLQSSVAGRNRALEFLDSLAEYADDYAALLTPTHKKWNGYPVQIRSYVQVMRELRVAQIRPLMLAVTRHFNIKETTEAYRRFVSWTVRFLISGGGRGGTAERYYSLRAQEVILGKIKTAKELQNQLADIIPTDSEFETAFSSARVSSSYLARYYLRAMESRKRNDNKNPELAPVEDVTILNLEHILPQSPDENWPGIDPEVTVAYSKRLGNLVLLQAKKNSIMGNDKFSQKVNVFKESQLTLTEEIATRWGKKSNWGPTEINERQLDLAKLAVSTWPLDF
jgi:hypothetical protein